jgi:integrase
VAKPKKFPQVLRDGSISVRIYQTPVNGCDAFTVSYYEGGKRRRIIRGKYEDARREADKILVQLNSGVAPSQQLSGAHREAYLSAVSKLKPLDVSLAEAVEEYVHFRNVVGSRAGLSEVARYYLAHAPGEIHDKSVGDAYDLYLQRAVARTSERNVEGVRLHVGKFADAFHCRLSDVNHERIEEWMDGRKMSGRYFNNCRSALITFFRWSRKKRFLADTETEAEKVEKRPETVESVSIFTPPVMKKILTEVRPDLIPYIVLSAFAGLRPSEARRLLWQNINWDEGYIEIYASQARKTLRDRFVPLLPNLRAWLEPYREDAGLVAHFKRPHEMLTKESKKFKFLDEWPEDVLRHSFGSYRLAILKNKQQLAEEMGNSPDIIVKNYRRPVTSKAAGAWFALEP